MTYYLGVAGSDSRAGTSEREAWRTFAPLARVKLGPGDRVLLEEGGTWEGPLGLTGAGSPEAPIVLGRWGHGRFAAPVAGWEDGFAARPRPRISGSSGSVVSLVDVSHWIVSSLEIECATADTLYPALRSVDDPAAVDGGARHPEGAVNRGIEVAASAGARGICIQDCCVHGRGPNQNSEGILVSAAACGPDGLPTLTDVRIRDNLVESVGWRGIGTESRAGAPGPRGAPWAPLEHLVIEGNAARNIGLQGICAFNAHDVAMRRNLVDAAGQYRGVGASWGPAGLWPWSCADVVIEHNEVTGMHDGNTGADATGIDIDWNSRHVVVRSNHCHGNLGCGIVTMSCRDCSIEENRVEGNLGRVNLGPGQIGLCDYQTAEGPDAISGVVGLVIRDNLIVLDRDNTAALSTVTISGGPWEGVDFLGNRVVLFDHARGPYAYDLHVGAALRRAAGNVFYGSSEGAFRADVAGTPRDLAGWRAAGRDLDAAFRPPDATGPCPVTGLVAERTRDGVALRWAPSTDTLSGVHHYNVYRGSRPSFTTRYLTLVGQPREPAYEDAVEVSADEIWYKVDAEDACGNRSGHPAVVRVPEVAGRRGSA